MHWVCAYGACVRRCVCTYIQYIRLYIIHKISIYITSGWSSIHWGKWVRCVRASVCWFVRAYIQCMRTYRIRWIMYILKNVHNNTHLRIYITVHTHTHTHTKNIHIYSGYIYSEYIIHTHKHTRHNIYIYIYIYIYIGIYRYRYRYYNILYILYIL
jgi:hypothetical protein